MRLREAIWRRSKGLQPTVAPTDSLRAVQLRVQTRRALRQPQFGLTESRKEALGLGQPDTESHAQDFQGNKFKIQSLFVVRKTEPGGWPCLSVLLIRKMHISHDSYQTSKKCSALLYNQMVWFVFLKGYFIYALNSTAEEWVKLFSKCCLESFPKLKICVLEKQIFVVVESHKLVLLRNDFELQQQHLKPQGCRAWPGL